MSEVIGDITYVGDDGADVIQVKQPQIYQKDTYELDRATVVYDGAAPRVATFVSALTRGQTMTWTDGNGVEQANSTMFLVSANESEHPWQREATLNYVGALDDLPPAQVKDSLATANISVSVTTVEAEPRTITLNIEYKAARTSYSWFTTDEPDKNVPTYTTVTNDTSPFDVDNSRITKWEITGAAEGETIALSDYIELISSLGVQTNYEDYQIEEIVPDALWKCSVVVQAVIVAA